MAELKSRTRWKRWAPDLGENRTMAGGPQLFLELQVDLTPAQLSEMQEKLQAMQGAQTMAQFREAARKAYAGAIGPHVRVFDGPHTVDGQKLATVDDYLELITQSASGGYGQLKELMGALISFNSISGPDELFSLPRSGGVRSTGAQSNDAAESPTASR